MIKSRRPGREAALRGLYAMEIGQSVPREVIFDLHENADLAEAQRDYAERILKGYTASSRKIDDLIERFLIDWKLERLAAIDRNLLRLATYELLFEPELPPAVTIDEAIELAKKYSTSESGKFINGVLGNLMKATPKAHWTPPEQTEAIEEPPQPEPEAPEETVTPEEAEAVKVGFWKVRREPDPSTSE